MMDYQDIGLYADITIIALANTTTMAVRAACGGRYHTNVTVRLVCCFLVLECSIITRFQARGIRNAYGT